MKVMILAGGFGTRLAEYTEVVPKPMVSIGGKPILLHIMNTYASFGHKDFYIALGYKAHLIKEYFLKLPDQEHAEKRVLFLKGLDAWQHSKT